MILATTLLLATLPVLITAAQQYLVYPSDRRNSIACFNIDRQLRALGKAYVRVYHSADRSVTDFWLLESVGSVPFPIVDIEKIQGVKRILKNTKLSDNCGKLYHPPKYEVENLKNTSIAEISLTGGPVSVATRPTPTIKPKPIPRRTVMQRNAPEDLDLVSWAPGKFWPPSKLNGYVYDVHAGVETYIYIIGEGLDYGHAEFVQSRRENWFFGPNVLPTFRDDSSPNGYMTCVASKASGWHSGVSKNSKLVVMKASHTLADNTWAFARILQDIISRQRQYKSVVLYPRCSIPLFEPGDAPTEGWEYVLLLMQELLDRDVNIVTCAGDNDQWLIKKRRNVPDRFPATHSSDQFPIIVAGSVTKRGDRSKFSRGFHVSDLMAWAPGDGVESWIPGDGVECASNTDSRYTKGRGTAFAAGMVAGMVAYYLDGRTPEQEHRGHFAAQMRRDISKRYSRPLFSKPVPGISKPNIIWNLQDGSRDPNHSELQIFQPKISFNMST